MPMTYKEQERLAYISGQTKTAELLGTLGEYDRTKSGAGGAINHIEKARNCLPGEDFLVPFMDRMRDIAQRRVTKQDLLDLINEMEDFQNMLHGDFDYARDELQNAMNALNSVG